MPVRRRNQKVEKLKMFSSPLFWWGMSIRNCGGTDSHVWDLLLLQHRERVWDIRSCPLVSGIALVQSSGETQPGNLELPQKERKSEPDPRALTQRRDHGKVESILLSLLHLESWNAWRELMITKSQEMCQASDRFFQRGAHLYQTSVWESSSCLGGEYSFAYKVPSEEDIQRQWIMATEQRNQEHLK